MDMKKIGMGILVIIIVIGIAVVAIDDNDVDPEPVSPNDDIEPDSNDEPEPDEALAILEHELVREDSGTAWESVSVEGIAQNVSGTQLDYVEISVNFYDEDGVRIDRFLANTNDLDDQEKWAFEVMAIGLIGEDAAEVVDYEISIETIDFPWT